MMATDATVLGLYSHIAHSVDKEEGDIPQLFKGKPEVEENLKENLKIKDKTHQKSKRWKRIIIMKALTIITIILQIRVEATDLIMVRAETDHLEDLYHEIEDKDLNSQHQFQNYRYQRSAPQQNRTQYGSACKPYFQGNQVNTYRSRGQGLGPQHFRGRARSNPHEPPQIESEGCDISHNALYSHQIDIAKDSEDFK